MTKTESERLEKRIIAHYLDNAICFQYGGYFTDGLTDGEIKEIADGVSAMAAAIKRECGLSEARRHG